jgi:hypothetical protein
MFFGCREAPELRKWRQAVRSVRRQAVRQFARQAADADKRVTIVAAR